MKVSWFSCGCSSFLATYLLRDSIDRIVYIHINDQHPDTLRFLDDAEAILGRKVEVIQSEQFKSVEEVIRWKKVVRTPHFAPCTLYLKKRVRTDWEAANLDEPCTYVWGYDLNEQHRAKRMLEGMPEFDHEYPLIDRMLSKEDVHGMCAELGIKRPIMYDMGYPNNNCIGCVRGGKGYWNAIRRDFPEVFESRAKLERELGHSCIKDVFLDELNPNAGRMDEVFPSCSFACLDLDKE